MATAIPFSNALRVRIWRGKIPRRIASTSACADCAALSAFSASSAAMVEDTGRLIPIASNTDDIVLAVNMPPHEPCPGQALRSTSSSSAVIDLAGAVLAHRLEDAHDREVAPVVVARLDRAAVDEDRRDVHPRDRDHGTGHVLVAAADGEHAVHALRPAGRLDGVRDDLAGHQRVLHPLGAHRDAVAHGDRAEDLRHAPPASRTAASARRASTSSPALHGVMVLCAFAMPTIGLPKSPSPKPTARSIARFGARWTPSVMALLLSLLGHQWNVREGREGPEGGKDGKDGRQGVRCHPERSEGSQTRKV